MNKLCILMLLLSTAALTAVPANPWSALQHDLGRQAALYRNSPEHLKLRSRDTRDYGIGDPKTFWSWNLSVMPPAWIQTPATCRAVGAQCYIFVADNQWNIHMNQADVDSALVRLEERTVNNPTQGAIAMDIELFGPIPDELDNDPRLIVFYSALGSFQGTSFDGYFSPYNQVTEAQAQQMNPPGHSNECEMIYMTCYPLDPSAPIRFSVLAHELQHLIHWGQDANEELWINEGCSELAMVAYGVPDPITGFPANPDNNLTAWNQTFADYVKVMLFFAYLQEHYDASGLILDLVSDPANGIVSLTNQIASHHPGIVFADIFGNWAVANIADGDPLLEPYWGYSQLDLPNFAMTNLAPDPQLTNQGIQPYATDYLKYTCQSVGERLITISSNNPVRLKAANFDLAGNCLSVEDLGTSASFVVVPPPASLAHHVVYVLANPHATAVTYGLDTVVGNDEQLAPQLPWASLSLAPNPFRPDAFAHIDFHLRDSQSVRLEIFNARGQLVRALLSGCQAAGSHHTAWDANDEKGAPVAPGLYLCRLSAGEKHLSRRLVLLPGRN